MKLSLLADSRFFFRFIFRLFRCCSRPETLFLCFNLPVPWLKLCSSQLLSYHQSVESALRCMLRTFMIVTFILPSLQLFFILAAAGIIC